MDRKIETVLLDFDGTIADTGRGIIYCVQYALRAYGLDETDSERLNSFIGPPLVDSFMRLYGLERQEAQKFVDKYREIYGDIGLYQSDPYEGAEEMLKALSEGGYTLAIASTKPEPYVRKLSAHMGFDKYFSFISAPKLGTVNPPKSELITSAISALGTSAEKSVMVGDRSFDILGAKAAGVVSIGAVYGYGGEAELRECGADMLAYSPIEVVKLIEAY